MTKAQRDIKRKLKEWSMPMKSATSPKPAGILGYHGNNFRRGKGPWRKMDGKSFTIVAALILH